MNNWGAAWYGDPCRECGYDWSITPGQAIDLITAIPQRYTDLLDGEDARLRHPDLDWTACGYVCHVTDNLRIWAERLVDAALTGDRTITGYDDVLLARARAYDQVPASGALWSLSLAATAWGQAMEHAAEADVVLLHPERGPQTWPEVAGTNAHDAFHHQWDIERTLTHHAQTNQPRSGVRSGRRITPGRRATGRFVRPRLGSGGMAGEDPRHDDTVARRTALARAVQDDLGAAGLPVVPEDADSSVSAGARVTIDPLSDEEGGGVFVRWEVPYMLKSAAMDALSEGRRAGDPSIMLSVGASDAMRDAIAEILTIAGYDVQKDTDDMAPELLAVLSRRPGPSWRDWLHDQTARRQKALMATARERENRRS
ncbi:hypothetical protein E1281_11970 [Actinomadura sp. KC345]|uniref:hypothetical protein n=1 Tax=Actinomadura sp. KC345 TaxID=2530371 RepID=UPI00104B6AC1|nr:hypothetical protein [Actinomadura sp. KC345]TDC55573.1 hypothetical protein E1281_11970 [Actinomadura sp. KC345]